jgi:SAM-dependent methyltransferase
MKSRVEEIQWSWDHPVIQDLLLKYYRDYLFSTPEQADELVQQVLTISSVKPPAAILDIGCGLGYHAASFASRGFDVLAFDPGDRYIDLAWAGAYCPGQLKPSELVDDFRRIYDALIPGRWFIATVAGKARLPFSEKVQNWEEKEDCFVLEEEWTDGIFCYEDSWFVYPDDGRIVKIIEVDRIYDVQKIEPLLKEAGFVNIETYCDLFTRKPPTIGQHFAFWCRRPEA